MTSEAMKLETKQRPWWLTLIAGIMAVIVGAVLLWAPAKTKVDTWMVLVAILGLYWLIEGILDLVSLFVDHSGWGWKLFTGIISIMAGGYILMYPIAAGVALPRIFVLVLGIWGLMQGAVLLLMAFRGAGWAAGLLGALGVILGITLIMNYSVPGMGLAMVWTAAVTGLIVGFALIIQAFRARSAGS